MDRARTRRRLGLFLFLVSFSIYFVTVAPGLTWSHRGADGGDFLAAAATLGVPHPAGYPTYTLLLHLSMVLLPVEEPAAAGNLFSAAMAAVAVALCGGIIYEVLDRLARLSPARVARTMIPWAAMTGALIFAFMPLVWSQALITEVYSLHLAIVAGAFWSLLRWMRTGRGLPWAGWIIGLGLTNHLTIAFIGPGVLAALVAGRKHLRWRTLLAVGGALCIGLVPYAYLPWAARRMPPVNWENPQTWEGFSRLVLAARYRHNILEPSTADVLARLIGWVKDFSAVYYWPIYLVLVAGLVWLLLRDPVVGVMTGTFAILLGGYAAGYGTSDYWVNLLPALMMLAVWFTVGLWLVCCWLMRTGRRWPYARAACIAALLVLPAVLVIVQWEAMDLSDDRGASEFVAGALEAAAADALVFTYGDAHTFGMWYACYALDERRDLVPIIPTFLRHAWYRQVLAVNHPGLDLRPDGLGREALQTMIGRHLGLRPIYLTWEDEVIAARYELLSKGPLWLVNHRGGGVMP